MKECMYRYHKTDTFPHKNNTVILRMLHIFHMHQIKVKMLLTLYPTSVTITLLEMVYQLMGQSKMLQ